MIKQLTLASVLGVLSTGAFAVPVYEDGGNDLQDVLNSMGLNHYDVEADQQLASYWTHSAVGVNSQYVFTDIGFGGTGSSLGIFSYSTGEKLELFDNSGTASASVSFLANGSAYSIQYDIDGLELNTTSLAGFGDIFGFYVTYDGRNYFYSDPSMNPGYVADGDGASYQDWMIAFQGDGSMINDYNGFSGGYFSDEDWLIAFDGILHGAGQLDFNDAVILVESVRPIPVPAAVWLFGTGLLGLMGVARRRA